MPSTSGDGILGVRPETPHICRVLSSSNVVRRRHLLMVDDLLNDTLVAMFQRRVAQDGDKSAAVRGAAATRRSAAVGTKLPRTRGEAATALAASGCEAGRSGDSGLGQSLRVDRPGRGHSPGQRDSRGGPFHADRTANRVSNQGQRRENWSSCPEWTRRRILAAVAGLPAGIRYFSHDACREKIGGSDIRRLSELVEQASQADGSVHLENGPPPK